MRRAVARRGLSWALVALVAIAAIGALQTSVGRSGLDALGATPAPAGYTEVAIAQAPKATADGRNLEVAFAITIHDVQDGGDYRWALVTTGSHAVGSTPHGGVAMGAGESRTVDVRATVRCDAGAKRTWVGARVDPEPAASVGTWLSCPEARP
jgi:hypothetical protein